MTTAAAESDAAGLVNSARGGVINLVGAAVNAVLGFVLVFVVARSLRAGGTGAFFEATALFLVAGAIAQFGSDTGLIKLIARDRALGGARSTAAYLRVALVPAVLVAVVLGAALYWYADPVAGLLAGRSSAAHRIQLAHYLRALAPFLPVYLAYRTVLAATRGYGTMVPNNVVDRMAKAALQPLLVALVAVLGLGSGAVATAWALPILLGVLPAAAWLRRLMRRESGSWREPRAPAEPASRGGLWRFSAPRGLAGVLQIGLDKFDILILGTLATTGAAGIYAAATRYLIAGRFLSGAIGQGMQPTLSMHFARNDHAAAGELYRVSTAWVVAVAWPVYLTMLVFAPLLLRVFGPEFASGTLALQVLAGATLLGTACGSVDVVLLMGGRSSWNLYNTAIALFVNVSLNLALIPRYGITGAALAWGVALVLANGVPLAQIWRKFGMHPFGAGLRDAAATSVLCFGILGVVIRLLFGPTVPAFLVFLALAGPAYLALVWWSRDRLRLAVLGTVLRSRRTPRLAGQGA